MAQLKDTTVNGNVELTGKLMLPNSIGIYALDTDGEYRQNIQPCNANNNCVIGYGNYVKNDGNTNIYGSDIIMCSSAAGNVNYRPYYRAGDSLELDIYTSGFVTNSGKDVYFYMPFARPIIGSPTVTITSNNGMIIRQDAKYTHGSSASVYAVPTSYSRVGDTDWNGLCIKASFTDTTNVTNNSTVGIRWSGIITFS